MSFIHQCTEFSKTLSCNDIVVHNPGFFCLGFFESSVPRDIPQICLYEWKWWDHQQTTFAGAGSGRGSNLWFHPQFLQKPSLLENGDDKEYKPHDLVQRQKVQVQPSDTGTPARRAKRLKAEVDQVHYYTHMHKPYLRTHLPLAQYCCCTIVICVSLSSLAVGGQMYVQEVRYLRAGPISGDGWALL